MAWTLFWDMHSGGGQKDSFDKCYIEAPEAEAKIIFYNRFGHNPERVSCTCCGEDYSISESPTLEQASGFHRNCEWSEDGKTYIESQSTSPCSSRSHMTIEDYCRQDGVCVIYEADIKDEERKGEVPAAGYVWAGD